MNKENEATRERVTDINKCDTLASVGEYLEDNPFGLNYKHDEIHKLLEHALYKSEKPNFTQYQLKLQSWGSPGMAIANISPRLTPPRAYAVLLRIMEIRFDLEKLT